MRNKSCWHIFQLQLVDLAVRGRDESAVTASVPRFLIGIRTMRSLTVTQLADPLAVHIGTEGRLRD